MKLYQLRTWIKAAPKIFVWASLSKNCSAYFQVSKVTIEEYLDSCESLDEEVFIEFGEDSEIFLGFEDQTEE